MLRRDSTAKWIVICAALVVMLAAVELILNFFHQTSVQIGSELVRVRLADTGSERVQGLSGTNTLSEGNGMLFIFDHSAKWSIWMKGMSYSIDIVWLDQDHRVVDIARNVSPDTYPKVFTPKYVARYVLELPANDTSLHSIDNGTLATFSSWSW